MGVMVGKKQRGDVLVDIGKRIKEMANYCDEETIAKTVGIPKEIIISFLNGEIEEDILSGYSLSKPPEIKVVEQKRFVRSRTIGILNVSVNDSNGALISAGLAIKLAKRYKLTLASLDINLIPKTVNYLSGYYYYRNVMDLNDLVATEKEKILNSYNQISGLDDFHVYVYSRTVYQHKKDFSYEKLDTIIKKLTSSYSTVLVDVPLWVDLENIIHNLDVILLVFDSDERSISDLWQVYTLLDNLQVSNKTMLICCSASGQSLKERAVRSLVKEQLNENINIFIPYDQRLDGTVNSLKNVLNSNNPFNDGIEKIIEELMPNTKRKDTSMKNLLKNFFG
jgi:hypothetical protein